MEKSAQNKVHRSSQNIKSSYLTLFHHLSDKSCSKNHLKCSYLNACHSAILQLPYLWSMLSDLLAPERDSRYCLWQNSVMLCPLTWDSSGTCSFQWSTRVWYSGLYKGTKGAGLSQDLCHTCRSSELDIKDILNSLGHLKWCSSIMFGQKFCPSAMRPFTPSKGCQFFQYFCNRRDCVQLGLASSTSGVHLKHLNWY